MSTSLSSQSFFGSGIVTMLLVTVLVVATPFITLAIFVSAYYSKRSGLESDCQSALSLHEQILPGAKRRVAAEDPQDELVKEVTEFSKSITWCILSAFDAQTALDLDYPWRTPEVLAALSTADEAVGDMHHHLEVMRRRHDAKVSERHAPGKD